MHRTGPAQLLARKSVRGKSMQSRVDPSQVVPGVTAHSMSERMDSICEGSDKGTLMYRVPNLHLAPSQGLDMYSGTTKIQVPSQGLPTGDTE